LEGCILPFPVGIQTVTGFCCIDTLVFSFPGQKDYKIYKRAQYVDLLMHAGDILKKHRMP
ncbi:MAG: hypothetical protein R6U20_09950, partial [Longimonas sp.]|uniref:hypothetical protein n=1 Tax=Longimonas sp. TaxID=2039626 RepID=UPI003976DA3B